MLIFEQCCFKHKRHIRLKQPEICSGQIYTDARINTKIRNLNHILVGYCSDKRDSRFQLSTAWCPIINSYKYQALPASGHPSQSGQKLAALPALWLDDDHYQVTGRYKCLCTPVYLTTAMMIAAKSLYSDKNLTRLMKHIFVISHEGMSISTSVAEMKSPVTDSNSCVFFLHLQNFYFFRFVVIIPIYDFSNCVILSLYQRLSQII